MTTAVPQIQRIIPTLPSRDLCRTERWLEAIGFEKTGRFDEYLIASRDGCELHYEWTPDRSEESPAGAYLRVRDVDALHGELLLRGARVLSPPFEKPWGMREFAIEDPDGNLYRFGAPSIPTS